MLGKPVQFLSVVDLCAVLLQSYCNDPDLVLELKNLIVIFADTLQVRPGPVAQEGVSLNVR